MEGEKTLPSPGIFFSKVSLWFLPKILSCGFQIWALRVPDRPRWAGGWGRKTRPRPGPPKAFAEKS